MVPYAGGYNSAMRPFPGHVDTAAQWARTEGCTGPPAVGSFDAGANLTVDTIDYASCRPGAAFSNWTIVSGQHFAPQVRNQSGDAPPPKSGSRANQRSDRSTPRQDASYKIFQALLTRFMLPATRASTA